jgi:dihydrofolate reductase
MLLNIIFAQSSNGIIGKDGSIPWNLPEDMQHFKRHTSSYPVIMGRKTWESLPKSVRPLPSRPNLVISHQQNYIA